MSSPDSGARTGLSETMEAPRKPQTNSTDSSSFSSITSNVFPIIQRQKPYFPEQNEDAEKRRKRAYGNLADMSILEGPRLQKTSPLVSASAGVFSGSVLGFVGSALQNAVQQHNHGWKGVFTRTGSTIWEFAIAGGLYGFVDTYAGNVREKDDAWNKFAGGCAAGFFFGMRGRSIPLALGTCVLLGTPVAVLQAQGGSLRGDGKYEHMSLAGQQQTRYAEMFGKSPETKMREKIEAKERAKELEEREMAKKYSNLSPELRRVLREKQKEAAKDAKEASS